MLFFNKIQIFKWRYLKKINLADKGDRMDKFTKEDLKELFEINHWPSISIYMPTQRAADTQQNSIRFKTLVQKSESTLSDYQYKDANKLLAEAKKLYNDIAFWNQRSDGLAMFISPESFKIYLLPHVFDELVVVTRRFHLKPLIPVISSNAHFYVLAVSQNNIRLLRCTHDSAEELKTGAMPASVHEFLKYDTDKKHLQFHTRVKEGGSGNRPAIFHGQGVGFDEKDNLLRFFKEIDKGLQTELKDETAPLVFAGVDHLFPIFKNKNSYQHLLDEAITGNPDELKAEELKTKAWKIVAPLFRQEEQEAAKRYTDLQHTNSTSCELNEIISAAYFGRVDFLFVAKGVQAWGRFDDKNNKVVVHNEKEPEDEDLLDLAAVLTIANSGQVFAVKPPEVPDKGLAAAVFRY
jgi:hypothetical protein